MPGQMTFGLKECRPPCAPWSLPAILPLTIRLPPHWLRIHNFEDISPLWLPFVGHAIKLFFSTSPKTLFPRFNSVIVHRGQVSASVPAELSSLILLQKQGLRTVKDNQMTQKQTPTSHRAAYKQGATPVLPSLSLAFFPMNWDGGTNQTSPPWAPVSWSLCSIPAEDTMGTLAIFKGKYVISHIWLQFCTILYLKIKSYHLPLESIFLFSSNILLFLFLFAPLFLEYMYFAILVLSSLS